MNEVASESMLSFVSNTLFCKVGNNISQNMPRVVPDQRSTFENDELFRKLSRECEVKYTGFKDRPHEERQLRFQTECREGHADIAFVGTGTNLQLNFESNAWSDKPEDRIPTREFVDFERESGKVHLKSQFILNGVCVVWRGWVDLSRLDGVGCLYYDSERAEVEDAVLREQIEQYNRRLREFEERQRQYREQQERRAEAEAEVSSAHQTRALKSTPDTPTSKTWDWGDPIRIGDRRSDDYINSHGTGGVRIPVPLRPVVANDGRRPLFPWKHRMYIL